MEQYPQSQSTQPVQPPQPPQTPLPPVTPMSPQPPKKNKTLLVIVVIIVLALVIGGAVAAYMLMQPSNTKHDTTKTNTSTTKTTDVSPQKLLTPSAAGQTVTTNCYTFSAPEGYTVDANATSCETTLTSTKDPKTTIRITLFTTDLSSITSDVVEYVNGRYQKLANDEGLKTYQAGSVNINAYQTGLLYMDSSDKNNPRKKAYYTIVNKDQKSKAANVALIQAFLVSGYADSSRYDMDVRLVASSFKISE